MGVRLEAASPGKTSMRDTIAHSFSAPSINIIAVVNIEAGKYLGHTSLTGEMVG